MTTHFIVYLKEGETLTLEFSRFDLEQQKFILYDRYNNALLDRYLAFEHVAAIVPEQQVRTDGRFRVILKNGKIFELCADGFTSDETAVKFVSKRSGEAQEIKDVFVAAGEIAAIIPIVQSGW